MEKTKRKPAQGGRPNKTGVKGVTRIPSGKFRATITVDKAAKYLGLFDTLEAARDAYLRAEAKYLGSDSE